MADEKKPDGQNQKRRGRPPKVEVEPVVNETPAEDGERVEMANPPSNSAMNGLSGIWKSVLRGSSGTVGLGNVYNLNKYNPFLQNQRLKMLNTQAWGEIMKSYKNAICISGTHGKTTTTSMMTHILMEAQMDPTVMIGGYLPLLHAGHRVGHGDTILLESCEYCDSFLNFFPTLAVVLNVEADHLDYFKDLADVQKSFHRFAELATFGVIANGDDEHTVQAMEGLNYVSFGMKESNRIHTANMCPDWRHFDVICDGQKYCHLDMGVLGKHNALNALAAAAAAWMMGIPGEAVSRGLESFHGAGRRMEFKGTFNGADVYDDYAHHPDEVAATIAAVRASMPGRRLVLAFQPHTYSRTHALFDDFVRELSKPDVLVLAEIYAARERNSIGISSQHVADKIPGAVYCETLPQVTAYLAEHVQEGDVVITMGAGDIYRAGEALLK